MTLRSPHLALAVEGLPRFLGHSNAIQEAAMRGAEAGIISAADLAVVTIRREARAKKAFDTGEYHRRWTRVEVPSAASLIGRDVYVMSGVHYAGIIELGRRPGTMPPPAELEGWVRRKLRPHLKPKGRKRRKTLGQAVKSDLESVRRLGKKGARLAKKARKAIKAGIKNAKVKPQGTKPKKPLTAKQQAARDARKAASEARKKIRDAARDADRAAKAAAKAAKAKADDELIKAVALAVARKIKHRGIEARLVVTDALDRIGDDAVREVQREMVRAIKASITGQGTP